MGFDDGFGDGDAFALGVVSALHDDAVGGDCEIVWDSSEGAFGEDSEGCVGVIIGVSQMLALFDMGEQFGEAGIFWLGFDACGGEAV